MKKVRFNPLFLILSLVCANSVAKTIYFGSETEVVQLVAGEETLMKFPTEVKFITRAQRYEIQPADSEQPSYTTLKVRPRFSSGSSQVIFTLADGSSIQTKLVVVPPTNLEKTSAFYEFKSKESLIASEVENGNTSALSDLELMKAMIRGDDIPGYDSKSASRSISPGFRGATVTLVRVYTGNLFNGYVFEVANNLKDKRLLVNIQNLMLGEPNQAILSNVDSPVLVGEKLEPGRNKTLLRIVAKPTAQYGKLILPIETVEKK